MKRLLLFSAMLLCGIGMFAKKQVVYVEYFSKEAGIDDARVEQVRSAVISALTSYQHLQVVDVASQKSLAVEKSRRSDEDALEDETARIGKMKKLGANYLIQGYIPSLEINEKKEYDDGVLESIEYNTSLSYTIKVVDCENGTLLSTDIFSNMNREYYKGAGESMFVAMENIPNNIKDVVTKNFKLHSVILDSDYQRKKNKIVKCYINIGSDDGVVPGVVFTVKKAVIKVGRVSWEEIGEIVVKDVCAKDLAFCDVTKGAKEIYAVMEEIIAIKESDPENAHDLIVESKSFR